MGPPSDSFQNGFAILPDETSDSSCDASLELMIKELEHRILNLLSVVQCFVNNTQATTADGYRIALTERIAALSDAYSGIERARQNGIYIDRLLEQTLKPHASPWRERILLAGPDLILEPRLALFLHMIFHELATNACKHGALRSASGAVEVLWDTFPDGGREVLAIQWRERGGPQVRQPEQEGFGLHLISRALSEARVHIEFDPAGVVCRLLVGIDPSLARRARSRS
ncbi:sensor histidine kinase [Bradyrhizobium sp. Ec3.3]|uniref:HWE histidine kinase domain-containing protein n=1 Tax=Bradyrhizobium sp. Ec3.3 TaxID=189753 RepID=UPI000A03C0FC